jgi:riboflavin synthase
VFTGLVEEKGALLGRSPRGPGARLVVACPLLCKGAPLELGESISVDGVCLTVDKILKDAFEADVSHETLTKTTLGSVPVGGHVNLERALPLGGRMGGHIVSGHVDGTGKVAEKRAVGDALQVAFTMPRELARYVAQKGSICVNGVSLTVNEVSLDRFSVVLVPHTIQKTSLHGIDVGATVNLEVDVLARYVARLGDVPASEASAVSLGTDTTTNDAAWLAKLQRGGFM